MTTRQTIGRATTMCISLAGRPGTFGSRFHNHLYGALGLDWIYKAFTTTDLAAAIGGVRALGMRGCAVSMPWKEACLPLLDELAESARAIASVNTIVNDGGRLIGYNTDFAAVRALVAQAALDRAGRVVVRGAGGMAKAVVAALSALGFENGVVVARHEARGRALAEAYGYRWCAEPDEEAATLLVNATPIGMRGDAAEHALAFPLLAIERAAHVVDVVAQPPATPLVTAARAAGRPVTTGDAIIVLQGVEQFVLYTGVRPPEAEVGAAAAYALSS